MEKFKIVAKTFKGLEESLASEIEAIGGTDIAVGTRMVSFTGDKALLYKANLWLRTAVRVLKPFASFKANDPDELYLKIKEIDWSLYIANGQTIAIDAAIHSDTFRHSKFAIYRTKDAICDFFTERGAKRPTVSVTSADIQINLHIAEEECTLSLDASGEPLYKRGYKELQTEAPINEILAAGILMKAGWNGERDLIDPMCGSGTFLIEAALIATNTPPGIYRQGFGFEHWQLGDNAFDEELWSNIYNDDSQEREFSHRIYGSDISKPAIEIAETNVKAAGLSKYISLEMKDFETYTKAPSTGCLMVCNPPYGKRLFTDIPTFYKMVGTVLKQAFQDCEAWIISTEEEPFNHIGLKPSVKLQLNNGGIDCELRKYEMFKGRFNDFRAEGGTLDKSERAEQESKYIKIRHTDRKSDRRDDRKPSGRKERTFDKDRKPAYRDDKKKDFKSGNDHRTSDDKRKPFKGKERRDENDRKPFRGEKPFKKERAGDGKRDSRFASDNRSYEPRGNFRRNEKGEYEEREGEFRTRGERKFDPNRPLFHHDFNVEANILDFTKPQNNETSKD